MEDDWPQSLTVAGEESYDPVEGDHDQKLSSLHCLCCLEVYWFYHLAERVGLLWEEAGDQLLDDYVHLKMIISETQCQVQGGMGHWKQVCYLFLGW